MIEIPFAEVKDDAIIDPADIHYRVSCAEPCAGTSSFSLSEVNPSSGQLRKLPRLAYGPAVVRVARPNGVSNLIGRTYHGGQRQVIAQAEASHDALCLRITVTVRNRRGERFRGFGGVGFEQWTPPSPVPTTYCGR